MLPFLEENNLYQSTYGPDPKGIVRYYGRKCDDKPVALFICPSDYLNTSYDETKALGSYAVNSFAFGDRNDEANGGNRIPANFPKGTSYTFLAVEHYSKCRDGRTLPPPGTIGPEFKDMLWNREQSRIRDYHLFQVQPLYDLVPPGTDPQKVCIWYRAQTPHAGVINVVLVDGSVRTVSPTTKESTWMWAFSPDDPMPPPDDW
jgi:prepilin-type processing-associated H-X9-DG protein